MVKNDLLKILLFSVFLLALFLTSVFAEVPLWSNNQSWYPYNYNLNLSEFNISWTGSPSTVYIEIKNSSSVLVNNLSMSNLPYGGDIYNFITILPAGTFNWTSFAQNTDGWNRGNDWVFTINKAPTTTYLLIDGFNDNKTVDFNWTANFTVNTNVSGRTIELWTNYSNGIWKNWILPTLEPSTTLINMSTGVFNFTANFAGDENYTGSNETWYVNVINLAPQYSNNTTTPNSSSPYSPNQNYQFNITWQDGSLANIAFNIYNTSLIGTNSISITLNSISNTTGLTNITTALKDNNTKVFSANIPVLPAGTYNYSWFANDSFGNNKTTGNLTYVINPKPVLTLSGSTAVTYPTETTVTCWSNDSAVTSNDFQLRWQMGSIPGSNTTSTSNSQSDIRTPGPGTYSYTCNLTNSGLLQNYTGNSSLSLTVSEASSNPSPGSTPSSGTILIQNLTSKIAVNAGESKSTTFTIKNTYSTSFTVNISVSGITGSWYDLDKSSVRILGGGSERITLTFNIPKDAETKNYTIRVTALGGTNPQNSLTLTVNPASNATNITNATVTTNATQNVTGEVTQNATTGPTGYGSIQVDFIYVIAVIGIVSSILIFVARQRITTALMRFHTEKPLESTKSTLPLKPLTSTLKPSYKPPSKPKKRFSFLKSKLSIQLKKPKLK